MGLFDTIREKAAELLSGVSETAGELAGDLPGADMLEGLSQSATDAADQAVGDVVEPLQDIGAGATEAAADATGSVADAADTVAGSFPDTPGEPPRP